MTKLEDDRQYAEHVAFAAAMRAWRHAANQVLRGAPVDRLDAEELSHEGVRQLVQRELATDERFVSQLRPRTADQPDDWLDVQVDQADHVVADGLDRAYRWTVSVLASGAFGVQGLRRRATTIRATALAFGRIALERSVIEHHPSRNRRRKHLAVAGGRTRGDLLTVTAALRDLEWMGTASRKPILKAWEDFEQAGFALKAAKGHGPTARNGGQVKATRWDLVVPDTVAGSYAVAHATLGAGSPGSSIRGACSVRADIPVCVATAARLKAEPLVAVMDVLELVRQWSGGAGGLGPAGVTLALLAVSSYAADVDGWVSKPWLEVTYGLAPSTLADSLRRLREFGLIQVEWDRADGAGRRIGDWAPRLRGDGVRLAPASTGELRALLQRISVESGARGALDLVQAGIRRERDNMWAASERHRLERVWCRVCGAKGPDCECDAEERDWVELPAA